MDEYTIHWHTDSDGTCFLAEDFKLALVPACPDCTDTFRELSPGVIRWDRRCESPTAFMTMRAVTPYTMEYQMRPAVQYNANLDDTIVDYQMKRRIANNEPEDPNADPQYYKGYIDAKTGKPWVLAWWNSSVPGAVYSRAAGSRLQCSCRRTREKRLLPATP